VGADVTATSKTRSLAIAVGKAALAEEPAKRSPPRLVRMYECRQVRCHGAE
jgi:hypothetical protein